MSAIDRDLPHKVKLDSPPCVRPHGNYRYQTCDNYTANIDGMPYVVPQGFDTDFASIPKFLWWEIAPFRSDLVSASIIHDHMYTCPNDITRKYADDVFYSALIESGMSASDASKMYYVVRYFGEPFFKAGQTCHFGES